MHFGGLGELHVPREIGGVDGTDGFGGNGRARHDDGRRFDAVLPGLRGLHVPRFIGGVDLFDLARMDTWLGGVGLDLGAVGARFVHVAGLVLQVDFFDLLRVHAAFGRVLRHLAAVGRRLLHVAREVVLVHFADAVRSHARSGGGSDRDALAGTRRVAHIAREVVFVIYWAGWRGIPARWGGKMRATTILLNAELFAAHATFCDTHIIRKRFFFDARRFRRRLLTQTVNTILVTVIFI